MNNQPERPDDEEARLARLLRSAGAREQPAAARREAVYAAVHAEWRQSVARRRHRAPWGWALAATVAAAAVAVWLALPLLRPSPVLAAIDRVEGEVTLSYGDAPADTRPAATGTMLTEGMQVSTGRGARAALAMGGVSVRIDESSRIALVDGEELALRQGAVYVDFSPGESSRLRIATRLGAIEHLGTQYEARIAGEGLRISVREGRVRLIGKGAEIRGDAGERLVVDAQGAVRREVILPHAADWGWASAIAPGFAIEGRPLEAFLRWVGRETGRGLAYATPAVEAEARSLVLRGSIAALPPEEALAAVLATTHLQARRDGNRWLVDARGDGA
jgi:hypothetical protein